MATSLETIDPQWAWAPFEPTSERPFDFSMAAHLYRRGGFGANQAEVLAAVAQGPEGAVTALLESDESPEDVETAEHLIAAALAGADVQRGAAAWLHRMLTTRAQAREKMTLFWHGHFATGADKVADLSLMQIQNTLIRQHALGDFRRLTHGIAQDPAMLIYLDSATNRKSHPNENFARELMELFCLGEGNYTEDDVLELARCFTGWGIKRRRFKFNPYQHDEGVKNILGQQGKFGGDEAVDVVLQQPATAEFIATKLVRFLVMDEPTPSSSLIAPLAETFRRSNLQILPLVKQILSSNLFYADFALARKIRSPVELAVGTLRCLEGTTNVVTTANRLKEIGQGLYYPPNVKGWEGGRAWINTATLLGRANLMGDLVTPQSTRFGGGGLDRLAQAAGVTTTSEAVDWFSQLTLAMPLGADAKRQLEDVAEQLDDRGLRRMLHAITTLPQAQIG